MDKIRTGMIRCDTHASYYAALMSEHDPLALREHWHVCHFYFYDNYDPKKIIVPTVWSFEITKVWDADRGKAEKLSEVLFGKPKVCNTFEEVSDDVDLVFVADCNGDGSDHLQLATPSLEKGVPTFVDKPLAYEAEDARSIVQLAKKHNTPMTSLSILRAVPHATRFRNRFAEIFGPEFGIVKGWGYAMAGQIHLISLAHHLFGAGVESVESMGQTPLAYVHLDYGGKPDRPSAGVILCGASGGVPHCSYFASAYSKYGAIHSPPIGDFEYPHGAAKILEIIKEMVETGESKGPLDEMVEAVAIATAARLSQKTRRQVYLREV